MRVVAFSGSPHQEGNIERLLEEILTAAGGGEIVRLAGLKLNPCHGCLKCAATNRCVQQDAGNFLLDKVVAADAIVLGAYPIFMYVNALTKTFLERMYPLKHRYMLTAGKVAASVCAGFRDAEEVERYLTAFFHWFRMWPVGSLVIGGNIPCLFCGVERKCSFSNVRLKYGPGASPRPEMVIDVRADPAVLQKARELGSLIREAAGQKGC